MCPSATTPVGPYEVYERPSTVIALPLVCRLSLHPFAGAAPAVFKCSGQEVGVVRGVVSYFRLIDN